MGFIFRKIIFLHFNEITSYILSILGIFGFFSLKIFLLKLPKLNFVKINNQNSSPKIKKEPIVNNLNFKNDYKEEDSIVESSKVESHLFSSPSLEILESASTANKKLDKELIRSNSGLLEESLMTLILISKL